MASANEENFLKIVFLLMKYGTKALQQRIKYEVRNTRWQRLPEFLEEIKHTIFHLTLSKECCAQNCIIPRKSYLHRDILGLMYLNVGDCCSNKFRSRCCCKFVPKADLNTVRTWDITLTSCLLLEFLITDRGQRQVVENIRDLRNNKDLLHRGNAEMETCRFEQIWLQLSNAIKEIAEKCEPHFYAEICESVEGLKKSPLTAEDQRTSRKYWEEAKNESQAQTNQTCEKITEICDKLSDLSTQQPDPELDNLLHFSKTHLKDHGSKVYVEPRRAMRHCIKLLEKHRFICVTGDAGSGKTRFGLQLMGVIKEKHQDAVVLVLTKSSQWFRFVSREKKFILFVDDILGKSNVSERSFEKWSKVFDAMNLRMRDENFPVFIIFSFRNCIWGLMRGKLMDYVLFNIFKSSSSPVDLSGLDFGMTVREKKDMLLEFCSRHGISVCKSLYQEDQSFESSDQSAFCLCEDTLSSIAKMQTASGFPLLCEEFFTNSESLKQRSTFFQTRSALKHFKEYVDNLLVEEKYLNYAVLVFFFLKDKTLTLDVILELQEEIKNIAERLGLERPLKLNKARIRGCLNDMVNIFISCTEEGYRIRHMVVYEAILLSFGENFPELFLECVDKSVVFTYVRSKNYVAARWEICMHLEMDMTKPLAEKLIGLYTPNSADAYTDVYKHPSFTDEGLVSCFLEVVEEDDEFGAFLASFVAGACTNKRDKLAGETIRKFNDLFKFDFEIFFIVLSHDLIYTFKQFVNNSEFKLFLLAKLQSEEKCRRILQDACHSGSRKCFLGMLDLLDESSELETDGEFSSTISEDNIIRIIPSILSRHDEALGSDWRGVLSKLVELIPSEIDRQSVYTAIISESLSNRKINVAQEYLDRIVSFNSYNVSLWILDCFRCTCNADTSNVFSAICAKMHDLNLINRVTDRRIITVLAIFGALYERESMVMKLLDEFDCDYEFVNFGDTILHACEASMFSDANLLTILRRPGAEVMFNTKNKKGQTPVQCRPSYPRVRKFLSMENLFQHSNNSMHSKNKVRRSSEI